MVWYQYYMSHMLVMLSLVAACAMTNNSQCQCARFRERKRSASCVVVPHWKREPMYRFDDKASDGKTIQVIGRVGQKRFYGSNVMTHIRSKRDSYYVSQQMVVQSMIGKHMGYFSNKKG